ncbi:MAG: hypothetical protein ACI3VD_07985 [Candidatus Limivicinus sp.]
MADDFGMGYALGQDSGGRNSEGFFGSEGIWAVIILAIIFGWGRNGFGGIGGGDQGALTRADLCSGFNFNNLDGAVRGVQQGLCDGFYAMNTSLLNGFNGVDNAVCTLGYQTQQGFSSLAAQLASCCCETQRAIDGVKYQMATDTCAVQNTIQNTTRDLLENQNNNTKAILDFLTQDKIATLQAENQTLKFAASQQAQNAYIAANQEAQTAELIRRLGRDCPVPAYVVPNPNCCYGNPVGVSYGGNNGCNSGCGCC